MTWPAVGDLALDSLYDSLKVLALAFVLYVLLSFFENKIAHLLERRKRLAPFFGSLAGAIPQCGISVVGADLYTKGHLTTGTLIAIFIACSDEALPMIFSDFQGKWYMGFAMLGIKIVYASLVGILIDLLLPKDRHAVQEHMEHCQDETDVHVGCCGHPIEEMKGENRWHEHLLHPLVHSLKISAYSYLISFLFGLLILGVGEENLTNFLTQNIYLSPLFAVIVGLIPNCASSVLISELYLSNMLPFGALLAGLSANAGLGPIYLFKDKKHIARAFLIMGLQVLFALILGYSTLWIGG
ncbi:MAG: putative manganese transporter [Erysipelotrichaceae bacterium]|nr:putative manganese transporter [Erysipelotrichaceae bacterium]